MLLEPAMESLIALAQMAAERFFTVPVGEPGVKTGGAAIGARGE
jgi:hypothetical protein